MATVEIPLQTQNTPPPFAVRRFSVEEYHALGTAGVFSPDDRVELLQGWIVAQMIHNPRHSLTLEKLDRAVRDVLGGNWRYRIQSPITTGDSEPEPDFAVIRGPMREDIDRHPGPEDVALLVEVADSSVSRDRYKAQIYAAAGIPVYWIVNLVENLIEVYSDPSPDSQPPRFHRHQDHAAGSAVPLVIDGQEVARIDVAELLP